MSRRKTLLIMASLAATGLMVAGALDAAGAFGGRGGGDCGGPGFGRMGGPGGFGRHGHGMRQFVDADKDGFITREEATAMKSRRFDSFDLDKDGAVTADEAINAMIKRFEGDVRRKIRMFDENGDGKVTRDEFNAPLLERFARRDSNGDGRLSADEMPRFMGRGEGGPRRFGPHRGWGGDRGTAPAPQTDEAPARPGGPDGQGMDGPGEPL